MANRSWAICLFISIVLLLSAKNSVALSLPDLPFDVQPERIQTSMTGGLNHEFAWFPSYDIGFTRTNGYSVTVDIALAVVDPGQAIKNLWETNTETIWTTHDRFSFPIVFDVRFVTADFHHLVDVHEGGGRGDMLNWYTGWPEAVGSPAPWAHEVGHMFGNFDEYAGGAVNPNGSFGGVSDSLMGSGLKVYDRHYQFVEDWANAKTGSVPLPSSLFLLAAGMLGVLFTKLLSQLLRMSKRT